MYSTNPNREFQNSPNESTENKLDYRRLHENRQGYNTRTRGTGLSMTLLSVYKQI